MDCDKPANRTIINAIVNPLDKVLISLNTSGLRVNAPETKCQNWFNRVSIELSVKKTEC